MVSIRHRSLPASPQGSARVFLVGFARQSFADRCVPAPETPGCAHRQRNPPSPCSQHGQIGIALDEARHPLGQAQHVIQHQHLAITRAEAPMPMVGMPSRAVISTASGSSTASITTLNAPASATAIPSPRIFARSASERPRRGNFPAHGSPAASCRYAPSPGCHARPGNESSRPCGRRPRASPPTAGFLQHARSIAEGLFR